MKSKFILYVLLISSPCFSQEVTFTRVGDILQKDGSSQAIFRVRIYNDTNDPICIPVSLSFGYSFTEGDTAEVVNIHPASDSCLTLSLYYTKEEMKYSQTRYGALPVILNPNSLVESNIRFEKPKYKSVYLELIYSNQPKLDYYQIRSSFESDLKFNWMNNIKFVDKKYQIR